MLLFPAAVQGTKAPGELTFSRSHIVCERVETGSETADSKSLLFPEHGHELESVEGPPRRSPRWLARLTPLHTERFLFQVRLEGLVFR